MTKQSQKKLERLLEKAQELFLSKGFKNVSVDEIASSAGISKMTVYKHFPSKDDLFIKVIINYSNYHMDVVRKMLDEKYHTIEKIECLCTYALETSKDVQSDLYKDIFDRPYILEKLMAYKREVSYSLWREILEDGVKKGEIRKLDIDFMAQLLMNLPNIFINSADIYADNGLQKLIDNLFDFLKYGLLGGLEVI